MRWASLSIVLVCHALRLEAQSAPAGESSFFSELSVFGPGKTGDIRRWVGGIDQGGAIKCRIGDRGGNCTSPSNCIFDLGARAEHIRNSFCMHERMERPYLGKRSSWERSQSRSPIIHARSCAIEVPKTCEGTGSDMCMPGFVWRLVRRLLVLPFQQAW